LSDHRPICDGPWFGPGTRRVGHEPEPMPPEPFADPNAAIGRIFSEQFYKFPIFMKSGGWPDNTQADRGRAQG